MSSSVHDIALSIISNGKTSYYSSVKGCGNLISELDFGVYGSTNPDSSKALKWTKGTDWEDCIEKLKSPLLNPTYGTIDVDFDLRQVRYNNSYAPPNYYFFDWIYRSIEETIDGDRSYISSKSINDHVKNKRIKYYRSNDDEPVDFSSPLNLPDYLKSLQSLKDSYALYALIELPPSWRIIDEELLYGPHETRITD